MQHRMPVSWGQQTAVTRASSAGSPLTAGRRAGGCGVGGVGDTGDSRVIAPGFRKNALLNLTGDRDFVTLHNGLSPLSGSGLCLESVSRESVRQATGATLWASRAAPPRGRGAASRGSPAPGTAISTGPHPEAMAARVLSPRGRRRWWQRSHTRRAEAPRAVGSERGQGRGCASCPCDAEFTLGSEGRSARGLRCDGLAQGSPLRGPGPGHAQEALAAAPQRQRRLLG